MTFRTLLALSGLSLCLMAPGCPSPTPPNPPTPPAVGGSVSVGGTTSTGGETPSAGAPAQTGGASTGGAVATGGSQATGGKAPCAAIVEPTPAKAKKALSAAQRKALRERVKLTGWQRDPHRQMRARWRPTYSIAPGLCSVAWPLNPWPDGTRVPFNQAYGSCTANAVGGILSAAPWTGHLTQDEVDNQIYPLATRLDPFPGTFPPDDTGSNGQSAWKAAVQLGFTDVPLTAISSIDELVAAMQTVSCMVGVDFYEKMFEPTQSGELVIGGAIAGGHQMHITIVNIDLKRVWVHNSWNWDWGLSRGAEIGGYAYFSFGTLQKLLNAGGEIDCPAYPPQAAQLPVHVSANDNALQYREAG